VGVFATQAAARELDGFTVEAAEHHAHEGTTLAAWWTTAQKRRAHLRSADTDRNRWSAYMETWECSRWPLASIGRREVKSWLDRLRARDHTEGAEPYLLVRHGKPKGPTKSGKLRRVPLIPETVKLLERWRPVSPPSLDEKVFPSARGVTKSAGHMIEHDVWCGYLAKAEISRPVRWHDLRHLRNTPRARRLDGRSVEPRSGARAHGSRLDHHDRALRKSHERARDARGV